MSTALFKKILGNTYFQLAPLLQQLHNGQPQRWVGAATVTWGKLRWVRALLVLARLPRPGYHIPCQVDFEPTREGERILRNFSGQPFHSYLRAKKGTMMESFGLLRLGLVSVVRGNQLMQYCTSSHVLGLPLPYKLSLRIKAREWCSATEMYFDVSIGLGWGIQFLRYRGHLVPVTS